MANLETLPTELQHNIFSYLLRPLSFYPVDGMPRNSSLHDYILRQPRKKESLTNHPFYNLAAVSRSMRETVEAFCLSLLRQHDDIQGPKVAKTVLSKDWCQWVVETPKRGKKVAASARTIWVKHCYEKCLFCGKKTVRRAIFNMLMWCCKSCDLKHYGAKISKTSAIAIYKVKEIHWRFPQLVFPDSNLKPLSVAIAHTAACSNTTLLLEHEVKELAKYIREHDPKGSLTRVAVKSWNLQIAAERAERARERRQLLEGKAFEGLAEKPIWVLGDEGLLEETIDV